VALRLGIPAVWSGVYAGGKAGEIVLWYPGLASCYRCLVRGTLPRARTGGNPH